MFFPKRILSIQNVQNISYQYAVNVIPIKVICRSLQEPPVPAFIVGDVRLDLVVLPLVSNQHAFNPRHLMDIEASQVVHANQRGAFRI